MGIEVWYKNPDNKSERICASCQGKIRRAKRGPVIISQAAKKKLSILHLGAKNPQYGKPSWNKGKTGWMSETGKRSIAEATKKRIPWNKGKKTGHIPWNKGKKNPYSAEQLARMSKAQKGKKLSMETRKKQSEALKISAPWKGKKLLPEAVEKMATSKRGKPSWMKGKKHKESTLALLRAARATQKLPVFDTQPELMMRAALSITGIQYDTQRWYRLSNGRNHPVDIFVEPNIAIEVDGNYFHAHPSEFPDETTVVWGKVTAKQIRENDKAIAVDLERQGLRVVRLWESDIKANLAACVERVVELSR